MHAPNSLSHGNSPDNLKNSWQLDGSQDKKDWRKISSDLEIKRSWREEERDTSLLGRRDRRKDDRGADAVSTRDISETRLLSSSDRWCDSNSRNSGHESWRDSKWSSRWGPEDKEKNPRTEKRTYVEKEDSCTHKQTVVTGSRTASERENDSREKWRPRHRMEVHAGGTAAYRSAPGFGSEKGRMEASAIRFAAGRGRSNSNGSISIAAHSSASASAIGSIPLDKNQSYCYRRGKLLDIYRRQKDLPSFDTMPDGMENVASVTLEVAIKPLSLVAPDAEEEVYQKLFSRVYMFNLLLSHIYLYDSCRLSLEIYGWEKSKALEVCTTRLVTGMGDQKMIMEVIIIVPCLSFHNMMFEFFLRQILLFILC